MLWRLADTTAAPDSSSAATTAAPTAAATPPRAAKPATPAPAARARTVRSAPSHGSDGAARRQDTTRGRAGDAGTVTVISRGRSPRPASPAAATRGVQVLDARLCRQLTPSGEWTCLPLESPPSFGRYYYLTRVAAPETLQVEHRWYRGDWLVQSVPLTIRAGSGAGFRTYSRQTIPEAQPGEWRVELRSPQGACGRGAVHGAMTTLASPLGHYRNTRT